MQGQNEESFEYVRGSRIPGDDMDATVKLCSAPSTATRLKYLQVQCVRQLTPAHRRSASTGSNLHVDVAERVIGQMRQAGEEEGAVAADHQQQVEDLCNVAASQVPYM